MASRREVLVGGLSAAAVIRSRPLLAEAPQPSTRVNFKVPPGACDCHTHIFGEPARYPLAAHRAYTPPLALPEEMARMHRALGVQRVVIVTASAYGTNNAATLDAMHARGRDARGVVVVADNAPDSELQVMHRAGVRGIRLYLGTAPNPSKARRQLQAAALRAAELGWHVQIFTDTAVISTLKDEVLRSPVPIVFDHFGGALGAAGVTEPGFVDLLDLVRSGKAYVKISAAYRFSSRPDDYSDMRPLAQALVAANPDRVLWATDWPHTSPLDPSKKPTDIFPFMAMDDGKLMNLIANWVPDSALRQRILVGNPARLYEF